MVYMGVKHEQVGFLVVAGYFVTFHSAKQFMHQEHPCSIRGAPRRHRDKLLALKAAEFDFTIEALSPVAMTTTEGEELIWSSCASC